MLGPAKGLTDVVIENIDIGLFSCIPGAIGGANPACEPVMSGPNMFIPAIVFRGAMGGIIGGIIPYILPVPW